ncbi:hypothetical protein GH810_07405 [Acetobacterium paludosum]|uniref:Uncharacterized protein n=1 Tax=Acetobacterium paludosum TaxID=52693 RepID=A0A923HVV0_9FIRM|nr:hypothetical protein [Acetobacterium paludosum]MBC3888132.1 hypothetical protein [Acetobacterium paludosum]
MNNKNRLSVDAWEQGHEIALACKAFKQDVEEEWVAEEVISCYNCRYRRFADSGIQCMKYLFPE